MKTHKKSSSLVDGQSLLVIINQSATPSSLLSGANVLTRLICQRLVVVRSILKLYSISYLADCIFIANKTYSYMWQFSAFEHELEICRFEKVSNG